VKPERSPTLNVNGEPSASTVWPHVPLGSPALHAALRAHLEPVSAAEQHVHALVPRHDVEYRVAATRPGVQLEIRLLDEHCRYWRALLAAGAVSNAKRSRTPASGPRMERFAVSTYRAPRIGFLVKGTSPIMAYRSSLVGAGALVDRRGPDRTGVEDCAPMSSHSEIKTKLGGGQNPL